MISLNLNAQTNSEKINKIETFSFRIKSVARQFKDILTLVNNTKHYSITFFKEKNEEKQKLYKKYLK